jgi:hypothetical protein
MGAENSKEMGMKAFCKEKKIQIDTGPAFSTKA